jgi:diguanylate cyclase (GGDEF)-like protein
MQSALPFVIQSGNFQQVFMLYADLARNHVHLQEYSSALNYLYQSQSYLPDIDDLASYAFYYSTAVQVYAGLNRFEDALLYSNQMLKLQQQMHEAEKKQEAQKYLAKFDARIKDSQNERLRLENALTTFELEKQKRDNRQNTIINSLGLALVLVLVCLIVFFIKRRNHFKNIALRDHLTGAPNRRAVLQIGNTLLNRAKSNNTSLAICLIDLDKFKVLNDSFGHDVGDEVLKAFAYACKHTLRETDHYGRYGGEEWLVILTDANPSHIESVFARLRDALNAQSIVGIPDDHQITFSMGVALYKPKEDENISQIINRADSNLYNAKDKGRNAYAI